MKTTIKELRQIIKEEVSKMMNEMPGIRPRGWAILPIGSQDLITGKNKYFNMKENKEGGTLVLVRRSRPTSAPGTALLGFYGIWGSKGHYAKKGDRVPLYHDQTRATIDYGAVVLDEYPYTQETWDKIMAEVIRRMGNKKSISSAVFK